MKNILSILIFLVFNSYWVTVNGKSIHLREANFDSGKILSHVRDFRVREASGLASSRLHPGILYTINDSGGTNQVFAIDSSNGKVTAVITINNAINCDWEDIAVGMGQTGSWQIIVGDTGGNAGLQCNTIYVIEEPLLLEDTDVFPLKTIKFIWDEDDCETLLVDPYGSLFLVSKVDSGLTPKLYLVPQESVNPGNGDSQDDRVHLIGGTTVWLRSEDRGPVAGDISPNGREVLLKTYDAILHYDIKENESILRGLQKLPSIVRYEPERQGESIAWDPQGQGFYTLSEGFNQAIWYHKRTIPHK